MRRTRPIPVVRPQPKPTIEMPSYNKVILMGNVTRAPELKYLPKGTPTASIGLAVNRKWKDDSGALREDVVFVDLVSYGRQAETLVKHIRKGSPLMIEGRLSQDTWEDKTTGQKKSKTRVVIETFQFIGAPPAQAGGHAPDQPSEQPSDDNVPY